MPVIDPGISLLGRWVGYPPAAYTGKDHAMGFSGLFWFDNQKKKSVVEKVRGAIEGYKKRFGGMPQLCLVNRTQFIELNLAEVDGVPIRSYRWCLEHHFIVGIDSPRPDPKDPPE